MPTTIRKLHILHTTRYTYDRPVERSVHKLHLCPIYDWDQRVLSHKLTLAPEAPTVEFEDVFGNWVTRFEIATPYTELTIMADSVVELLDVDPFGFVSKKIRPALPFAWMPWEQAMIAPYLRPVELPDTQLQELFDYAMSFVQKNDNDLMETLFDINLTIFRDYQYVTGSTNLHTTPYDVFVNKKGVCQDFANLFICMARLLGIPARYVCGYIYTGNTGPNRARSDATHAWVQLYIPNIGWKGFDPTNGVLPETGHVRVGYGRHYQDATPTSGTLYNTAATEAMTIEVTVSEVD
jgi:transglutaminase-like putative cysteine protease